ncbi:phage replication initiation protein, NGO0469 family [Methylorubrum sp. SB2]|uniref:phage replication initiation protein, NGO0469 family n=1 Tax=Methylorubrum subtropicum TaxID=3138812 RepID=UPI00313F2D20
MKPLKSSGGFQQPPAGPHPAILFAIIDLGTQEGTHKGKVTKRRKILMRWELHGEGCEMDDGKPMSQAERFTLSSHQKGNLRKFMEAWRSKAFTDDEFENFDLRNMLGKPCILTLTEDGDYMNVNGITKLMAGMTTPEQVNPSLYFSLAPGEFEPHVFDGLSDKLKELIRKSPEYVAATHPMGTEGVGGSPMNISTDAPFDDDIPF